MGRKVAVILVAIMLSLSCWSDVAGRSQLLQRRGLGDTYSGVESISSAQDPSMVCCSDISSNGPVGLINKDDPNQPFIEGGNQKFWDSDISPANWALRPYWSYNLGDGNSISHYYPSPALVPANYYKYSIFPSGVRNNFIIRICYGANYGTCIPIKTVDMGRSHFTHTAVGGEGICGYNPSHTPTYNSCPIGYSAFRSNYFLEWKGNKWYSYCFTEDFLDFDPHYFPHDEGPCSAPADWFDNYR